MLTVALGVVRLCTLFRLNAFPVLVTCPLATHVMVSVRAVLVFGNMFTTNLSKL